MRWKRPLFLFHRWAGIVLCLFFALWFLSGLFMMYVEFPQLTRTERLAGAATLDSSAANLQPADAVAKLHTADFDTAGTPSAIRSVALDSIEPRSIRLAMITGRPAYVIHLQAPAQPRVVFADNGEILRAVPPEPARRAAFEHARRRGLAGDEEEVRYLGSLLTDQWTVSAALNDHRPLLHFALSDATATEFYVSSRTGEVVRDSHRRERVLNYFGAVTHWLYPTFLRKYPEVWEWIVDLLSSAGVLLGISGLWIGVLRYKRRREPRKPAVPYRGIMRWHYFAGITFGAVAVTWVFSGLLSMNPLGLNPPRRPAIDEHLVFAGKALAPADFQLPLAGFGAEAVEAELLHYRSQPFYRVTDRSGTVRLVPGSEAANNTPSVLAMAALAPQLLPGVQVIERRLLTQYDDHYYTRHPEHGEKMLPVLRVRFDDPQATWFHLDPVTGQVLERSTHANRVYRWLYNGLHSWDIRWLWERRPLWDICVIVFSLGGVLLSLLGIVIGVRRLSFR